MTFSAYLFPGERDYSHPEIFVSRHLHRRESTGHPMRAVSSRRAQFTHHYSPHLSLPAPFLKGHSGALQCFIHREGETLYQESLSVTHLRQFYSFFTPAWFQQSECGGREKETGKRSQALLCWLERRPCTKRLQVRFLAGAHT